MVIGVKDISKLIAIPIIACCAVFVCTLFLNFNMDIISIENEITAPPVIMFYDALVSTGKVVCALSGGCLLLTSLVMLIFYVKHYIDTHKKELGILKALGYSNFQIAKNFWIFGITVFIGAIVGFFGSFLIMPAFYRMQNQDKLLPEFSVNFHPSLLLYLVILPTIFFALLAILYAYFKLKQPVLALIKESFETNTKSKTKRWKESKNESCSFVEDLKKTTLKSRKSLVFFIIFASFCYSSMTQMSFSMNELSSVMMGAMIMIIGIVLSFTTLFLAITTVINGNTKTIAMMRVFGYQQKECCKSILGGYRPIAYIGFVIGTIYQYALLKIMVSVVFKEIENVPEYNFDFIALIISLISFVIVYEFILYCYTKKIKNISIKEIMSE